MTTKRRKQAWLPLIALVTVSVLGIGDAPVSAVSIPVKLTRQTVSLTIEKSKSGTRYGTKKVTIKKAKGIKNEPPRSRATGYQTPSFSLACYAASCGELNPKRLKRLSAK